MLRCNFATFSISDLQLVVYFVVRAEAAELSHSPTEHSMTRRLMRYRRPLDSNFVFLSLITIRLTSRIARSEANRKINACVESNGSKSVI